MQKTRIVPEGRIRTITTVVTTDDYIPMESQIIFVIDAMAVEIAAKLKEFHKIKHRGKGVYEVSFDIIVPPCPEDAI